MYFESVGTFFLTITTCGVRNHTHTYTQRGHCLTFEYIKHNSWCTWSSLQWRNHERDGTSNHRRPCCLFNHLFRCRSKKTSKLCVTGLDEGKSTGLYPPPPDILITPASLPLPPPPPRYFNHSGLESLRPWWGKIRLIAPLSCGNSCYLALK